MYEGGYYRISEHLLKPGRFKHTSSLNRPVPDSQLLAINRVQETPWRINPNVYAVLIEAFESNTQLAALPSSEDLPLPAMLDQSEWAELPADKKAEIKAERERIHGLNAKSQGQRESLLRKLSLARELDGHFWFPHSLDWRGRGYVMSQDLHPQSDDIARGILEFAEGKPLGATGSRHLALRLAGDFGMDKVTFDERIEWVLSNERLILDCADNPLDGERFWCEAEKPWQFLAAAFAWREYTQAGDAMICHLPIPYDATCSGLQHLSAMGLSEYGGRMVNLMDLPERHDVYQVVADRAVEITRTNAAEGDEMARLWLGNVGRKTVKRQTMTICYGATRMGMRKMALEDGHCDFLQGPKVPGAVFITDVILKSIGSVLTEGKLIMDWLQECAKAVSAEDMAMEWTTPIGMQVRQAYHKRSKKRVVTLFGEAILWEENAAMGMDPGAMRQAIVPNVIHSYDASHLYQTVNRTTDMMGEELSWAMVHDSFATHAGDSTVAMNVALREQFAEIYSEDQLAHLKECFEQSGVTVPPPPQRGTLDINQVRTSEYFFS